jgi:CubicO group peptidase (beta-lactamase class C family)
VQLAERGRINLDTPVVQYLPYFELDDERCRQITARQILSHTAGMPDHDESEYDELVAHPEYDEGAAERYVRSLRVRKMIAAPGERFQYSNIGYNLLGDMISKVSGQSFEAYMKEQILIPAGMPGSTFFLPEVDRSRLAVPHLRTPEMIVNPVYPYHRADAPASFLHATLVDMCHWLTTCLNRGVFDGPRLLSPAGYEMMWTPVAEWGYPPLYEHIGLGWTLGHFDGVKTVSHGGMGFGWTDFLTILPEKGRAAVILCNEESSARSRTIRAAIHTMLDREPLVNTVSWMVPIGQALQAGGIQAAYACYAELKDSGTEEYFFDEDELLVLVRQMVSAGKFDRAIETLELNIHAFPDYSESYTQLAALHLQRGEHSRAEVILLKALAVRPGDAAVAELLEKVRGH